MDADARAEELLSSARVHEALGNFDRYRAAVETGLGLVRGSGSPVESLLLGEAAKLPAWRWDADETLAGAEAALAVARASGVGAARAELALGIAHFETWSRECLRHFRAAEQLAQEEGDVDLELEAAWGGANAFYLVGRAEACIRRGEHVRRRAAALSKPVWEHAARWTVARHRLLARAELEQPIAELRELLNFRGLGLHRPQVLADLALALAEAGDLEQARRMVAKARRAADTDWAHSVAGFFRGEIEWLSGRSDRALTVAEEVLRDGGLGPVEPAARSLRLWSLYDLGRPEGDPALTLGPTWIHVGAWNESQAFAHLAAGELEAAEARFEQAAGEWHKGVRRRELQARLAAAETALRRHRTVAAGQRLREVETTALQLGLGSIVARVRRSLHDLEPRRPRKRGQTDGRLSKREREVLQHVADDRSSRETAAALGVAVTTVETHIRHAMEKLGARTRAHAAALAATPAATDTIELSPLQLALLGGLASGETVVEAASRLGISRRTATRRIAEARQALGLHTNAAAAQAVSGRKA